MVKIDFFSDKYKALRPVKMGFIDEDDESCIPPLPPPPPPRRIGTGFVDEDESDSEPLIDRHAPKTERPGRTELDRYVTSYCPACGGSDDPIIGAFTHPPFTGKVMTGHKLGCPRGKVGERIGVQDD